MEEEVMVKAAGPQLGDSHHWWGQRGFAELRVWVWIQEPTATPVP